MAAEEMQYKSQCYLQNNLWGSEDKITCKVKKFIFIFFNNEIYGKAL
jgi:hypothetical protein